MNINCLAENETGVLTFYIWLKRTFGPLTLSKLRFWPPIKKHHFAPPNVFSLLQPSIPP